MKNIQPKIISLRNRYPVPAFIISFFVLFFLFNRILYIPWISEHVHPGIIYITGYIPYLIIRLFNEPVSFINGSTIVSERLSLEIILDCCALLPMIVFASGVLSFPAAIRNKLIGLGIVLPLLFVINIIRIASLYFIGVYIDLQFMNRMHLDVWQGIFILISLALFFIWIKRSSNVSKIKG